MDDIVENRKRFSTISSYGKRFAEANLFFIAAKAANLFLASSDSGEVASRSDDGGSKCAAFQSFCFIQSLVRRAKGEDKPRFFLSF